MSEATIRRGVRNARYAAIPNHVFEDARLSMEARWLLGYLLSKPDNWTVVVGDIVKKGGCGRDKARKMIAELVEIGYAEREQQRDDGKFGSSVLVIFDEPRGAEAAGAGADPESVAFLPQTDLPAPVMPSPVLPAPVKSAHSNNSYLANTENQGLREGGREASDDRSEESADELAESAAAIEKAFWRLVKGWPGFDGMPKRPAQMAWTKLSAEERQQAADKFSAWLALLKAQKKTHVPAPATYFGEKLWQAVSDQPEQPAGPKLAAPYGKLWMTARFSDLHRKAYGPVASMTAFEQSLVRAGKTTSEAIYRDKVRRSGWTVVNAMHERAADAKGYPCPADLLPIADGFRQVHRDGDLYAAWRREHERRGWPFLDDTRPPEWVHFPAVADGWETDPDAAVQAAIDDFAVKLREVRGDEHAA
ncbi:helix-turn-helix domain-containing protein [Rhizobium sp. ARZ01]|uniref:helix-turn-helix domain-containing protein n=1 Tax=Rhizobium sp. ARZ01 TaxID=2769313 RepID=UPI0017831289|nr:helix-turn-helix domain-containing protein [Rhizobium sp. ARZ01]MBD9372100.1 helix-turn-helix domain-containing protein [Rhizobium sp. ARZ01]